MTAPRAYAEIGITTNFSFLRGASHPQDYVHQASAYGLHAIGIADHNTMAGVVRAYAELGNDALACKPKLLIGARLVFADGTPDILAYPCDRAGYGRLCQLLSQGKLRAGKGGCLLGLGDVAGFSEGLLLVVMPAYRIDTELTVQTLATLSGFAADGVWLGASLFTAVTTGAASPRCMAWQRRRGCRSSPPTTCCIIPRSAASCRTW